RSSRNGWLLLGFTAIVGAVLGYVLRSKIWSDAGDTANLPGRPRAEAISAPHFEGAIQESVGGTDIEQRVPRNKEVPDDMVWIRSGSFWMGGAGLDTPDTQPVHMVTLHGFWMDRHEVTNERFARFVAATDYKTIAERIP